MAEQSTNANPQPATNAQDNQPRIKIRPKGSYLVTGNVKLTRRIRISNAQGDRIGWQAGEDYNIDKPVYKLCRCGRSNDKPFCDDTHDEATDWDPQLTADRAPRETRQQIFQGTGILMTDDMSLCASFAFCDRFGGVWNEIEKSDDPKIREQLKQQIPLCPSGRLQYLLEPNGAPVEVQYEPMIAVIPNGPYWVLGGIPIEAPDGFVYEVRNRQLICRCGQSKNKPFCDGTHWEIHFKAP